MQSNVINPVLDAKYAAFVAAGLTPAAPTSTESWIASRRSSACVALISMRFTCTPSCRRRSGLAGPGSGRRRSQRADADEVDWGLG